MGSSLRKLVIALPLVSFAFCALADESNPARSAARARSPASLTGKERLGPKWTDEQRIDNCKVPEGKRGTRPRPTVCPDHLIN